MRTLRSSMAGFSLLELMIVVAIIGLLAGLAFPAWVRARTQAQTKACINNLRQIDAAKEHWALAAGVTTGAVNEAAVNEYIKDGAPSCPTKGTYDYKDLGIAPTCTVSGHAV